MKLIEDYRNTLVKIDEIDELIMGISHDELIFYRNKIQKLIDLIERYKNISVSKPENQKTIKTEYTFEKGNTPTL